MSRWDWRWQAGLALVAGLPLAGLMAAPGSFLAWEPALYSDLLTAHLPLSTFVHNSLAQWGSLPLWNPLYLAGQPLVGDPLAGLAYPPLWLTYAWPSPAALHWLQWLHLVWAGVGLSRLVRGAGGGAVAGLTGGAALVLAPRLWGQWGLGHVTLVFAVSWTPWLVLAARRAALDRLGPTSAWLRSAGLTGGVLGLIFCLDPRWLPPAGLAAVLAYLWTVGARPRSSRDWWQSIRPTLVGLLVLAAAAAALALPLARWLAVSTRGAVTAAPVEGLPVSASLALLLPSPGQWPEWSATAGLLVVLLAAVAVLAQYPGAGLWLTLAVAGLILSWGPATPLYTLLTAAVPGLSLLRMPGRWFLLTVCALAVLAGMGAERLMTPPEGRRGGRVRLTLFGGMSLATGLLLAVGWVGGGRTYVSNPWPVVSVLLGWALHWVATSSSRRRWTRYAVPGLIILELSVLNAAVLDLRPIPEPLAEETRLALPLKIGEGRLFSPTYAVSHLEAARHGLELAGGISPLQMESSWRYFSQALGFPADSYSVTVPPYPSGDPARPEIQSFHLPALGVLNVTHFASERRTTLPGISPATQVGALWIEPNAAARPRAWLQASPQLDPASAWRPVETIAWQPNQISVEAIGPGVLVLSEIDDPRWQVAIDGAAADKLTIGGLLRGVQLGAGSHRVVFTFRPWEALFGALLTAGTWLGLAILWRRR